MAITISGENNNDKILAQDGVIDQISGLNIVGVLTASSFSGDLTGNITGNVTGNINNSTLLLQTGGTERLRIDSSGRVLIGTTTVGHSTADDLTIASSGSGGISIRADAGYASNIHFADGTSGDDQYRGIIQYHHNGDSMRLFTNATEKVRITSAGYVGILQTSPDYELDVTGRIGFTQQIRGASGSQGNPAYAFDGDHDTGMFRNGVNNLCFATAGVQRLTIDENGKLGLGVNASNPSYQLQIHESDNTAYAANATVAQLAVGNVNSSSATNAAGIHLFTDGNGRGLVNLCALNNSTNASADFVIQTRHSSTTAERLRILSNGKVGIGVTTPSQKLSVFGNIYQRTGDFITWNNGDCQIGGVSGYHFVISTYTGSSMTEKLRVTSDGKVGINDNNPANQLVVKAPGGSGHTVASITSGDASTRMTLSAVQGSEGRMGMSTNHPLALYSGGLERARLDTSNRLLVRQGTAADPASETTILAQGNSASNTNYSVLDLRRGSAASTAGNVCGYIRFSDTNIDSSNRNYAWIAGMADGDSSSGADNPGRLVFATCPDNSTGLTERLRIDSSGRVLIGTTTVGSGNADNLIIASNGDTGMTIRSGNTSDSSIYFADPDHTGKGYIQYDHNNDSYKTIVNGTQAIHIDNDLRILLGKSSFGGMSSGVVAYGNRGGLKKDALTVLNATASVTGRGAGVAVGGNTGVFGSFYGKKSGNDDSTDGGNVFLESIGDISFITNGDISTAVTTTPRLVIPSDGGLELKTDGRGVKFPDTQTPRNSHAGRVGISSEMRYYETGTFVPGLSSTVLNSLQIPVYTDASYARRIGRYVRCGHLVFCNIEILMASTITYYQAGISAATAPVCITNVTPFYYAYNNRFASSGQPDYNPCNVFYSSSGLTNDTVYACLRREFPGPSYIQITKPGTNGSNQFNSTNYGEVFPANAHIAVSYTYAIDTDNIDN